MGDRQPSRPAGVLLAAIVAVVAVVLWLFARRVGTWTNDEEYFVQIARAVADGFPRSLVDLPVTAFEDRGLQRITFALLAWPLGALGGVAGFEIARAAICLAFASAAVPAYLLARGVRLAPWWALATAGLCVVVPWAVLTSTFLAESVAYPAALWALYGAWRATVRTGLRSDLLALGLVALAGLARTNLLVLVAVAPAAVALGAAIDARARGRRGWIRRGGRALWSDHPLLTLVLVAGIVVVALNAAGIHPGALSSLSGSYVTTLRLEWSLPDRWADQLAPIVLGVGVIPAVLAPPWVARAVGRGDAADRGLALCCVLGLLAVLLSTIYAAPEERYTMVLAPMVVLPGLVALARRDVRWWAVALSGLVVVWLVVRQTWSVVGDFSRLVTFGAETFHTNFVLTRLDQLGIAAPRLLVALGLLATVAALAAVVARGPSARTATRGSLAALAVLAVVQLAQAGYTVTEYASAAAGPTGLRERTWVDRRVGDDRVAIQAEGVGNELTYQAIWREAEFWNRRPDLLVSRAERAVPAIPRYGTAVRIAVDARTGRLRAPAGRTLPRWFLVPTLFRSLGLLADPVARSAYLPVELVRLRGAPRATYSWTGQEIDGWLSESAPEADAEVFAAARAAAPRPCLTFTLQAPQPYEGLHRYVVDVGARRIPGALRAGARRRVRVPLASGVRRVAVRATEGFLDADGRRLGVQVADTGVGPC